MKLRVYKTIGKKGNTIKALINEDTQKLIFHGDCYEDKIDERIKGFLCGLEYSKLEPMLLENKTINNKNKMYFVCKFDCFI